MAGSRFFVASPDSLPWPVLSANRSAPTNAAPTSNGFFEVQHRFCLRMLIEQLAPRPHRQEPAGRARGAGGLARPVGNRKMHPAASWRQCAQRASAIVRAQVGASWSSEMSPPARVPFRQRPPGNRLACGDVHDGRRVGHRALASGHAPGGETWTGSLFSMNRAGSREVDQEESRMERADVCYIREWLQPKQQRVKPHDLLTLFVLPHYRVTCAHTLPPLPKYSKTGQRRH